MKIYINYTRVFYPGEVYKGYTLFSPLFEGKLKLIYDKEEYVQQMFDCRSNGWGRRPCDEGIWYIRTMREILQPAFKGSKRHWFAWMEPQFKTDQTEIGIHPDNLPPGTRGCNGVNVGDDEEIYHAILDELEKNKRVLVHVFHNIVGDPLDVPSRVKVG